MFNIKNIRSQQAFSLVEVVVALAVFAILAAGVFNITTSSYRNFYGKGDKQVLKEFAQEGIEAVKAIRNNSWQDIENVSGAGNQGITKDNNGYWEFSGSSNTLDVFTRVISITDVQRNSSWEIVDAGGTNDPLTKKVTVTVSADGMEDYVLTTYITDWAHKTWLQTDWSGVGAREFWEDAAMSSSSVTNLSTSTSGSLVLSEDNQFSNGYTYRKAITIDSDQVSGSGDLTDFPMFFSDTLSYLKTTTHGGEVTNDNGYDIVFASDSSGATQLDHEIERYNSTTGQFEAWVEVPTVSYNSDTTIYLFYASSTISTSQEDVTGTWNSNFVEVMHMKEDPAVNTNCGQSGSYKICDSTSNNNDAYAAGTMTASDRIEGPAGYALDMDGGDDYLLILDSASLDSATGPGQARTWSLWLNITAGADNKIITDKSQFNGYQLWLQTNGTSGDVVGGVEPSCYPNCLNASLGTGSWKYLTITFDGSAGTLYVNGSVADGPFTFSTVPADNNDVLLVGGGYGGTMLDAHFDELRISNVERSAGWVVTEYNNMNSTSTFYSISDVSGYSSPGVLYSSIFNIGSTDQEIHSVTVEQSVPSGCDIDITLEASDSASFASGVVSETYSDSSADVYTSSTTASINGKRYIRYKATLTACNSNADTPTLYSVEINYR